MTISNAFRLQNTAFIRRHFDPSPAVDELLWLVSWVEQNVPARTYSYLSRNEHGAHSITDFVDSHQGERFNVVSVAKGKRAIAVMLLNADLFLKLLVGDDAVDGSPVGSWKIRSEDLRGLRPDLEELRDVLKQMKARKSLPATRN